MYEEFEFSFNNKSNKFMKKNFNEVINNLKSEIYNSIIEEFETYNKNEVDLWRFDVDDEVRENEIINEWMKLTQTFFIGTNCIANKIYKMTKTNTSFIMKLKIAMQTNYMKSKLTLLIMTILVLTNITHYTICFQTMM